ncbi:MAG: hypothetical protein JWP44_290 [Mucilaginibacter sp.]|nr:hypothetical protein [Mucilaginibacter sp.]
MKIKLALLILSAVLLSCGKDHNNSNIVVTGILTDCPANTTCTYNYSDNADYTTSPLQTAHGNYRVFVYKSVNANSCDEIALLYFKTSLSNNNFDINASEIASGQTVTYGSSCTCCEMIAVKPIGGEIKGKRTDASHWLINATIILGGSDNKPVFTLTVNQYFTVKSL